MIPDRSLSISQGAIVVMGWQSCADKGSFTRAILDALAEEYGFDLDTPFEQYPQKIQDILIHGTGGKEVKVHYKGQRGEGVYDVAFEGIIKNVERRYRETGSDTMKQEYETCLLYTSLKIRITLNITITATRRNLYAVNRSEQNPQLLHYCPY